MIVTCEQCSTQFQLDDSRVPARGVRVRCSRCTHSFFVKPDSQATVGDQEDPIHSAAERALEGAGGADGPSESTDASLEDGDSLEDSDWQFNEDVVGPIGAEEDGDRAQQAIDDLLGSTGVETSDTPAPRGASDSGAAVDELLQADADDSGIVEEDLDVDSADLAVDEGASDLDFDVADTGRGPTMDPDALELATQDLDRSDAGEADESGDDATDTIGFGDLDLGGDDDFEDLDLDPSFDTGTDLEMDASEASGPEETPPAPAADPLAELDALASDAPDSPPAADLGSPENWDFFSDDGDASVPRPGRPAPQRRAAPVDAAAGPELGAIAHTTDRGESDGRASTRLWISRALHGVGWLAVAALVGATLFGSLLREAPPAMAATSQSVAGFEAAGVEGRWIDNQVAGPVFVISGELRNPGPQARAPGVRLSVALVDASGAPLIVEAAALGPELPTRRLREEDPHDLRALQATEGLASAWSPIAAGEGWRFHAVLGDVPPETRGYRFVAAPVQEPAPVPEQLIDPENVGAGAAAVPVGQAAAPGATATPSGSAAGPGR